MNFINTPGADALRTVEKVNAYVQKSIYVGDDGFMKDFFNKNLKDVNICAQNFKPAYTANGYLDVLKNMDLTHKYDLFHELNVIPYIMEPESVMNIDEHSDIRH